MSNTSATNLQSKPSSEEEAPSFNKPRKYLTILDWDNTILPTSWLVKRGCTLGICIDHDTKELLKPVEKSAYELIIKSLSIGEVIIITNGETGWIEKSCEHYLPRISFELLHRLKCMSARSTFEFMYSKPDEWKIQAFNQEICLFMHRIPASSEQFIMSIGDSIYERKALFMVTHNYKSVIPKSIKLVEEPSVSQLERQHKLITDNFAEVTGKSESLDLMITINELI